MKRHATLFAALMFAVPAAMAYQVTGPVLDVTDSKIVVEKDNEKWEIARDKDTKVTGDLKKGSRVTVQYKMTATSIDVRDTKDTKKEAKESKKEAKKDGKDGKSSK
ncbi:MAG: hypothetical protein ACM3SS_00455 [Rhodospirillaceae bacterium]